MGANPNEEVIPFAPSLPVSGPLITNAAVTSTDASLSSNAKVVPTSGVESKPDQLAETDINATVQDSKLGQLVETDATHDAYIAAAIKIVVKLDAMYEERANMKKFTKYAILNHDQTRLLTSPEKLFDTIRNVRVDTHSYHVDSYRFGRKSDLSTVASHTMPVFISKILPARYGLANMDVMGMQHVWGIFMRGNDDLYILHPYEVQGLEAYLQTSELGKDAKFRWNSELQLMQAVSDQSIEVLETADVPLPAGLSSLIWQLKESISRHLKDKTLASLLVRYVMLVFAAGRSFMKNYHQKEYLDKYLKQKNFYYVENKLFDKVLKLSAEDAKLLFSQLQDAMTKLTSVEAQLHDASSDDSINVREDSRLLNLTLLTLKDGFISKVRSKYYKNEGDKLDVVSEQVLSRLGISSAVFSSIANRFKDSVSSWWTSFSYDPLDPQSIEKILLEDSIDKRSSRERLKKSWQDLSQHPGLAGIGMMQRNIESIIGYFNSSFSEEPGVRPTELAKHDDWSSLLSRCFLHILDNAKYFQSQEKVRENVSGLAQALTKVMMRSKSAVRDANTFMAALWIQVMESHSGGPDHSLKSSDTRQASPDQTDSSYEQPDSEHTADNSDSLPDSDHTAENPDRSSEPACKAERSEKQSESSQNPVPTETQEYLDAVEHMGLTPSDVALLADKGATINQKYREKFRDLHKTLPVSSPDFENQAKALNMARDVLRKKHNFHGGF